MFARSMLMMRNSSNKSVDWHIRVWWRLLQYSSTCISVYVAEDLLSIRVQRYLDNISEMNDGLLLDVSHGETFFCVDILSINIVAAVLGALSGAIQGQSIIVVRRSSFALTTFILSFLQLISFAIDTWSFEFVIHIPVMCTKKRRRRTREKHQFSRTYTTMCKYIFSYLLRLIDYCIFFFCGGSIRWNSPRFFLIN